MTKTRRAWQQHSHLVIQSPPVLGRDSFSLNTRPLNTAETRGFSSQKYCGHSEATKETDLQSGEVSQVCGVDVPYRVRICVICCAMSQDFSSPKLPSPRLSCEALSSKATYESSRGSSESPLASGSFSMFSQYAGDYHNRSPQSQSPPYAGASSQPLQMIGAHQPHGTSPIGQPIHFTSGQFAGRTIRAELHEQQKADLGRKSVYFFFDLGL